MRNHHKSMLTDHDNIHLITCLVLGIFSFSTVMLMCS